MAIASSAVRVINLDHLDRMMVPAGIVQFANGDVPDLTSGTCLDDNIRAWLVAIYALAAGCDERIARSAGDRALAFTIGAQRDDGLFFNMADIEGRPLEELGSTASLGRAAWVIGTASRCATVSEWRNSAVAMLDRLVPAIECVGDHHARAYAVLGLSAALAPECAWPLAVVGEPLPELLRARVRASLERLTEAYIDCHDATATDEWPWWAVKLTWANGRMPEALLRLAIATSDSRAAEMGLRALEFLASITQPADMLVPIGNDGWYPRGGARAMYDQQPIDACAMVDAWLAAYALTRDPSNLERASAANEWFLGRNTEHLMVGVPATGGCHDGLLRGAVNPNQGAESTLSYLHSQLALSLATR